MRTQVTIALAQSKLKESLSKLLALTELTTEQRAELESGTNEMEALSVEMRAATAVEGVVVRTDDGPADRELRSMIADASVGAIFAATLEHRATVGREAELQAHFGLGANQVPLQMLETRATGPTPAPDNVGQNQAAIIPAVFPDSVAAFLGVDMPVVGVGEATYPVMTTSADAGTPAENAEQAETAGAFTAEVLSPSRIQASFRYSREDRARFAGMDSALRENLSMALSDKLDSEVLRGTKGLLTGTILTNHNVNTETTYALYRSQFAYSRVDGTYASATADLRAVMGSDTFAHAASQYRGNSDNTDALMALGAAGIPVRVSAHVPDAASSRQNAVVRLGMRRDAVAPVWQGVTLIADEITKAAHGQIVVTAILLHAVKVIRKAGFHKQQSQHA